MLRDMSIMNNEQTLKNNRTHDVKDEKYAYQLEMEKNQAEDAARDKLYEEFEAEYADHIEGKIDAALRTADRPSTAYDEEGGPASKRGKTAMSGGAPEEGASHKRS